MPPARFEIDLRRVHHVAMPPAVSTVEELLEEQQDLEEQVRHRRRLRLGRRVMLALLALIVVAAAAGVFGQRTRTASAAGGGYRLHVQYPYVVRDGPPASFTVTVRRPSGFDGPVEIVLDASYLSAWEQPEVSPQPDSEQSEGDDVVWTFSPPDGRTLVVRVDGQLSSEARFAHHGRVAVRDQGKTVAGVALTTWVWP